MVTTNKPLLELEAADLMSEALHTIPQEMSLSGAARLLSQAQVTGAPVVDARGRCVGVLSATDFMHWAEKHSDSPHHKETTCFCEPWQIPEVATLPEEAVSHFMCKDPVVVQPHVRMGEIARMMLDAHIHRVIVVNGERRPIGIVTTTDILAALAYAEGGL